MTYDVEFCVLNKTKNHMIKMKGKATEMPWKQRNALRYIEQTDMYEGRSLRSWPT